MPYYGVLHINLKALGKEFKTVPAFVVPDSEYRSSVPLLMGTNVIRASSRHLRAAYGKQFLHRAKENHPEWHTALLEIDGTDYGAADDIRCHEWHHCNLKADGQHVFEMDYKDRRKGCKAH